SAAGDPPSAALSAPHHLDRSSLHHASTACLPERPDSTDPQPPAPVHWPDPDCPAVQPVVRPASPAEPSTRRPSTVEDVAVELAGWRSVRPACLGSDRTVPEKMTNSACHPGSSAKS